MWNLLKSPPRSLRVTLSFGLLLLGLTLVGINYALDRLALKRSGRELMLQRANGLGLLLSAELTEEFTEQDRPGLLRLMWRLREVPHLQRAFVCDSSGVILAAFPPHLVSQHVAAAAAPFIPLLDRTAGERVPRHAFSTDEKILWAAFPLTVISGAPAAASAASGWFCTESDVAGQERPMREGLQQRTVLLALMTLLICGVVWFFLDRRLTRRVGALLDATRALAAGRLEVSAPAGGGDELAALGGAFNQMADSLRARNEALHRSEERLVQAIQGSDLGTWDLDTATGAFLGNEAWGGLLGYAPGELAPDARAWQALIHPDDLAQVRGALDRHLAGATAFYESEYRMRHKSGHWIWVADKGRGTRRDATGQPGHVAGTTRDVSARRRAEHLLEAHRDLLEIIARGQPLEVALDAICRFAAAQAEGMLCSILLLDADGVHLRHGAAPGLPEAYCHAIDGLSIGADAGSCGTAAFLRAAVVVEDIATDPRWARFRALALPHGLRACWSAPILSPHGAVLGTFALYYHQPRRPEPEHESLIRVATQTASLAIQRHHTEAARRASEQRFRQLFETNQAIKLVIRPSDGAIVDANAAACTFYGYDRATLLFKRITDINCLPAERVAAEMERARSERRLYFNFPHRLASGEVRDVEVYTGPFETAEGSFLFSIIHDITERKFAEKSLQAVRANLEALVEAIPDAIFFKDGAGRWLVTNRAAQRLFQVEGEGWFGKTDAEMGRERPAFRAAHERCIESDEQAWIGGGLALGEELVIAEDGTPREFEVRKMPQFDAEGRRQGLVIIGRDVTARKRGLQQLREAEERFSKAFRASPVSIFFSNMKDGRLIDVNDAFVRMFGYDDRSEVIGRTSYELNMWQNPRDRDGIVVAMGETGSLRDVECCFRKRNGELGVGVAAIERIELHGEARLLSFLRDITEHKRAETFRETLLALETQLSAANTPQEAGRIIFAAADKLWTWDAGCLEVYSTEKGLMLSVLSIDVVDGRRREVEAVHPIGKPNARFQRVMQNGAELTLRQPPIVPPPDAVMFGETSRPSASLMTVPVRWKEQPVGLLSVQSYAVSAFTDRDLHTLQGLADHCGGTLERLRAAEAFQRSEARLAEIFANLDDVVFVLAVNPEGRLVYESFNPRCEQITGLKSADVCGRSPEEVLPPRNSAELIPRYRACLETGAVIRYETDLTYDPGRRSWSTTLVPIRNEHGRVYRIAGISRDITDRRQMEEQLRQSQKMEAIGQLAGGIAHDFNNMLTAIILQAQLARGAPRLPADINEALGEILATAERSAALTRQLLLFSRRQVMQLCELDLNDVVTGISSMLRRVLGEDISLQLRLGPGRLLASADAGMIDQVILNLAVNARDAMPRGGQLFLETDRQKFDADDLPARAGARPGRFVVLRVRDTGTGIPAEILPHIFEPFFTTKELGKGTGLGLATVFGIVEQHRGWIEVQSEPAKGTVFHVFLPAVNAPDSLPATAAGRTAPRGGTETILLVEDEPAIRVTARLLLEKNGYRILDAADGIRALEIWQREHARIDVLLTDLVMPGGISGHDLAQRLLASRPNLKVIFTTGYSRNTAGRDFELQPGQHFLSKPFGPDDLLAVVNKTCGR